MSNQRDMVDRSVQRNGPGKTQRIDLGLDILLSIRRPGERFTHDEIAYFCGCTRSAIFLVEHKALRKLRNRAMFIKDPILRELLAA